MDTINQESIEQPRQISPERALRELTHWASKRHGYIQVVFYGDPHLEKVNGVEVPHPWLCLASCGQEVYSGWGVVMGEAINRCFEAWQKQE
jgi:hypothetical protein